MSPEQIVKETMDWKESEKRKAALELDIATELGKKLALMVIKISSGKADKQEVASALALAYRMAGEDAPDKLDDLANESAYVAPAAYVQKPTGSPYVDEVNRKEQGWIDTMKANGLVGGKLRRSDKKSVEDSAAVQCIAELAKATAEAIDKKEQANPTGALIPTFVKQLPQPTRESVLPRRRFRRWTT